MRPFVCAWVRSSVRQTLPCGHNTDYFSPNWWLSNFTSKLWMMRGGTLLIFGSRSQTSYLDILLSFDNYVGRLNTALYGKCYDFNFHITNIAISWVAVFHPLLFIVFLCRLRSIAAHRDHFVRQLSVCLSDSHTLLVVTLSYVSQATHAFLGMLPLCLFLNSYGTPV